MKTEEKEALFQFNEYFKDKDLNDLNEEESQVFKRYLNLRSKLITSFQVAGYHQDQVFGFEKRQNEMLPMEHLYWLNTLDQQMTEPKYLNEYMASSKFYGGNIIQPVNPDLAELQKDLHQLKQEISKLKEEQDTLKKLLYDNATSYGAESVKQLIPVHIYLNEDDPNKIYSTYQAVLDFLHVLEFETIVDFEAKKGSWWKQWISSSKKAMTSKEVTDRLKEAEYAVEVNTILKPQSEVEKNQSEALLNILKSFEGTHHGVIRIGSLLVVKVTSKEGEVNVQVRTLNIIELHTLNKHPELLNQPQQILAELLRIVNKENPGNQGILEVHDDK